MSRALPILIAVTATLVLTRQDPSSLDVRELRLVDAQGRVRARLAASGLEGGPGASLELLDTAGRPAARLMLDDGPRGGALAGLELFERGRPSAWFGRTTASDARGAELRLLAADGTPTVELGAAPSLWLRSPARPARAGSAARPEGHLILGDGKRWDAPDVPMTLRVEGGNSGLRFDCGARTADLEVRRRDGRYVRLIEGY